MILVSVIVFAAMFLLVSIAEVSSKLTEGEDLSSKLFLNSDGETRSPIVILRELLDEAQENGRAIVIGLIPAMANFLISTIPDLAILIAVILLGTMIYLCWWYQMKFESVLETVFFVIMELILFWELKASISTIVASTKMEGGIWRDIVLTAPTLLLIAAVGFFIISSAAFHQQTTKQKVFAVGTAVVLLLTAFTFIKGETAVVKAEEGPWWHFYNSDVQKDEDKDNDFNFGPTAYKEEKVKERTVVKTTAEEADKEFRERIKKDPALGAADMAWFDAIVKTRYIGSFYDEVDKQWDAAINKAKETWLTDEAKYKEAYGAFFLYLDKATKVEIIERASGLDDQMYMNPATVDSAPDVIVMATENHKGHFLRYTFKIKEKEVTVEYRLECGFQPCNVERVMGITPKNKKKTTPKPSGGGGGGNTPTPTPTPKPDPKPQKDPSKSQVLPNDDPGPGENTNNPGSNYSTKDLPTNSNHMTYPEYKEKIEELKEINETQKVGGDPNTPSTPTPPDTTVHSNAEEGTGHGGVDTPTPVAPAPVAAETQTATTTEGNVTTNAGEQINTSPGQPWGGPKD